MKLNELTRKDLINDLDKRTKRYSSKVKGAKYIGITKDFVIHISVPSVTVDPSMNYLVKINLLDYKNLMNEKDLTIEEIVRLSLEGDMKVSCTCPAFKFWGYKYITTQLDSNEGDSEDRFPSIRNPKLEGTVCKHIYIAVRGFGKWWRRISSDISKGNFIEV